MGAVAGGVVKNMGDTPTGKIVATIVPAPAPAMVTAMFMILEQLQVAPEIVRIAFAATMGALALALGLALAFGLGGSSVAERMLEDAYRKAQDAKEQVRRDTEVGRARADVAAGSATSGNATGAHAGSPGTATTTSTTGAYDTQTMGTTGLTGTTGTSDWAEGPGTTR